MNGWMHVAGAALILVLGAGAGWTAAGGEPSDVARKSPAGVAPPVADYRHVAVVPAGAELIVLAGQIGLDPAGQLPPEAEAQLTNALDNVRRLLRSEEIGPEHVIKANIWLTRPVDRARLAAIWSDFHAGHPPPLTLAYVAALARPEFLVEVEIWAARSGAKRAP